MRAALILAPFLVAISGVLGSSLSGNVNETSPISLNKAANGSDFGPTFIELDEEADDDILDDPTAHFHKRWDYPNGNHGQKHDGWGHGSYAKMRRYPFENCGKYHGKKKRMKSFLVGKNRHAGGMEDVQDWKHTTAGQSMRYFLPEDGRVNHCSWTFYDEKKGRGNVVYHLDGEAGELMDGNFFACHPIPFAKSIRVTNCRRQDRNRF